MIEDPVIKSWAIAAQSTQAVLFNVPTENMRRIFRYIEALQAERDEALEDLSASQGYIADAIFALDKQKAAEAERDRMREALEDIIADCEADYPPSHGAIKYAARAALKGETP